VGTVLYTFAAFVTLLAMQMYFECSKLSGQFIRSIDNAAEPEMRNISSWGVFLQQFQKGDAIQGNFLLEIFIKFKKPLNKWDNERTVACRASVISIRNGDDILFFYLFCQYPIGIA